MLLRNNPNIDFDALEADIASRLERYQDTQQESQVPEYDAERLERARVDMSSIQHENTAGGLNLLYSLEDRDFAMYAHKLFLGRSPTAQEAMTCTERLRSGENKTRIASELRYSEEGRDRNPDISLKKEHFAYKLISLPIVGGIFNLLSTIASMPVLRQTAQARENHQYRLMESLKSDVNRTNQLLSALKSDLTALTREFDALKSAHATAVQDRMEPMQSAISSAKTRLSLLEQRQQAAPSAAPQPVSVDAAPYTDDSLYIAFEERYRGSMENIRERLSYYLPLVKSSLAALPDQEGLLVVDIGCGRGEWLKLLEENNIESAGIDTNLHNYTTCSEQGLTIYHEDALAWLSRQEDASLACISAFHVIEHLDFNQLNLFIDQALRCLRPEGLLLLETPNPENLLVGSNNFYLDPTHVRPLPPGLMEFLLSYKGYKDVEVHRIHPVDRELMIPEESETAKRCNQLFYEAQDYAVSCKKSPLEA